MAILQKNTHTPLILERCPCVARKIKILWEKRMNEGRPYLQMWRGVRVNCHSFLPIRQIWIGRPILQDGRHTIITNSAFLQAIQFIYDGQEENYGNFAKRNLHPSPHLQIRPSLAHPFLSQDKLLIQMHLDVLCNARGCFLGGLSSAVWPQLQVDAP